MVPAASCIKRQSSAKRQRRFIVAAIYFYSFAFGPALVPFSATPSFFARK
jgi:hypothetical protein